MPVAVGILERCRNVPGVSRSVRLQQTSFLEPDGVEDLIVPEQVAARLNGLGDQRVGQPDSLRALNIKLAPQRNAGLFGQILQHRFGKLAIERRVDHDRPVDRHRLCRGYSLVFNPLEATSRAHAHGHGQPDEPAHQTRSHRETDSPTRLNRLHA